MTSTVDAGPDGGPSGGDRRADAGGDRSHPGDAGRGSPGDLLRDRPYELFVPDGAGSADPAPLVLLLHGYGASGAIQAAYFGLLDEADNRGFLVAYPDGLEDDLSRRYWNATDACCDFGGSDVDDVAYLTAVLDDIEESYEVDRARVYVVGHSNGGFMAHRLACERADRIAAIVTLAGATWNDASACDPSEPVAVVQVHGDYDSTILYEGGDLGGHAYPSAHTTVERWADLNQCEGELERTEVYLDLDSQNAGRETRIDRVRGCAETSASVELWTIEGGRHIPWLRNPEWSEAVADFLLAHAKR